MPNLPATVRLAVRLFHRRVPGRPGQRLAHALAALGPSFIKLGQALATRSDLLGEEVADDLAELQDRLPPFSAEVARARVAAELGSPVEMLFAAFEDTPVAAASMAQVHLLVIEADLTHEFQALLSRLGLLKAAKLVATSADVRYGAPMATTIFSRIVAGEIPCHRVYEDDHVLAFLDIGPLALGHTLVIPKERAAFLTV